MENRIHTLSGFVTGLLISLNAGLVTADQTTSYTYNALGLVETVDGPRIDVNDITTYGYDVQGNKTSITNALGQVTQINTHDAAGRPTLITDPNGVQTTLVYDPRGRLITRTTAGQSAQTDYDAVGNVVRVTGPDGRYIDYEYDAARRVTGYSDTAGNRVSYTLDTAGNTLQTQKLDPVDVLTYTHGQVYDEMSRLIQDVGAQGQTTQYALDPNGNRRGLTDALGRTTNNGYDALNRLITLTDPMLGLTQFGYDSADNLASVTDANGLTTGYTYTPYGEVATESSPNTGLTANTYDEAGNLLTKTDARGIVTTYSYDALNRLTAIQYPTASLNITLTYDQGQYGAGRLTGMNDPSGTTAYGYDAQGNLISQSWTHNGVTHTVQYGYDAAGNLIQLVYPSGRVVDYQRDAAGNVSQVTSTENGTTETLANSISHLPFGGLKGLTYGNGLILSRSFTMDYLLDTQNTGTVQNLIFNWDLVSNLEDITDNLDIGNSQHFDYDELDRLGNAMGGYGDIGYSYDPVGNRLGMTEGAATDTYQYTLDTQLLESVSGANPDSRTYDAVGNTLQTSTTVFTYSDANRMASAAKAGKTTLYTYNGKGERVIKDVDGIKTHYIHDQAGKLIAEATASGAVTKEYIYLDGQPLAMMVRSAVNHNLYTFTGADMFDPTVTATMSVDIEAHDIQISVSNGHAIHLTANDFTTWDVMETPEMTDIWFDVPADGSYWWFHGNLTIMHITGSGMETSASFGINDTPDHYNWYDFQPALKGTPLAGEDWTTGALATLTIDPGTLELTLSEPGFDPLTFMPTIVSESQNGADIFREVSYIDDDYTISGNLNETADSFSASLEVYSGADPWWAYLWMDWEGFPEEEEVPGTYYYHLDHLGTPEHLTGSDQAIVWTASKRPFGEMAVTTEVVKNHLRFPGQYFDSETGLHYNYFRDYDPSTGRYIQSDPIELQGGMNTYLYANGNPVLYVDHTGEAGLLGAAGLGILGLGTAGSLHCYKTGLDICEKKYPNHGNFTHSDYRDFMKCTSSVAGIIGLGMSTISDPIGSAASSIGGEFGCDDKCE
ncbi:MAG: RHS domain-containing protein [gamma proteobacterium endosymbiont of Lamellibrachia anaximandri]|nr:RHS domain-containing protein [gamma proteobacterium endosymbiont of Lamellibrachia anaximandri]